MSIMPSANANSSSPLDVSSEIAVVIVLVNPLILPPTINDSPTSDMTRPNPMISAANIAKRASLTTSAVAWNLLAPRELAVSIIALSTPLSAEMVSPVIIGDTKITCPITIAAGVNRSPRPPSGPALEMNTKIKRPTTTVGTL